MEKWEIVTIVVFVLVVIGGIFFHPSGSVASAPLSSSSSLPSSSNSLNQTAGKTGTTTANVSNVVYSCNADSDCSVKAVGIGICNNPKMRCVNSNSPAYIIPEQNPDTVNCQVIEESPDVCRCENKVCVSYICNGDNSSSNCFKQG